MGERERQENSAFLAAVLGGEGLVNSWCIVLRANYTPWNWVSVRNLQGPVYSSRHFLDHKMRNARAYMRAKEKYGVLTGN